jgi:protein involved in polysaccharide export with SLBB domain
LSLVRAATLPQALASGRADTAGAAPIYIFSGEGRQRGAVVETPHDVAQTRLRRADIVFITRKGSAMVCGAVTRPGFQSVGRSLTVGEAIKLAGGALSTGHPQKTVVLRASKNELSSVPGVRQETVLRDGDILVLPFREPAASSAGRAPMALSAALSLLVSLTPRTAKVQPNSRASNQ